MAEKQEGVQISLKTLREIEVLTKQDVKSERQLLDAFRSFHKLSPYDAIVRIDPSVATQVANVAQANGETFSDRISQYIMHGIETGFFESWEDRHFIAFGPREWERLKEEVGSDGPTGRIVLEKILQLRALRPVFRNLAVAAASKVPLDAQGIELGSDKGKVVGG